MGERHEGGEQNLTVALGAGAAVDVSATLRGWDGIDINQEEDEREIPGGGKRVGTQYLGYKEGQSSMTVDINIFTVPLFWMKSGRLFNFVYSPEGVAPNRPRWTWSAKLSIRTVFSRRGVGRFTCRILHDGLVTEGAH